MALTQTSVAGSTTGSLTNYLMGNNSSVPEIGKGATVLHWTDRHAYEVISVSKDRKKCTIQRYAPERTDNNGMSESQTYDYKKLTDYTIDLVYRRGGWYTVYQSIEFVPSFLESLGDNYGSVYRHLTIEQLKAVFGDEAWPQNEVEGITRLEKEYRKVSIAFGILQEYYDYSF
jgi:hypothetical protein